MSYIFDSGPLSALFRNYYRSRFRTLWQKFDALVEDGSISSVKEVFRELEDGPDAECLQWARDHQELFAVPVAAEGVFIGRIYAVAHFQQNIEQQKLLKGGRHADAFVIAKAFVENKSVVTTEKLRPNAVKVPNICHHFGIHCLSLEDFMEAEGWEF